MVHIEPVNYEVLTMSSSPITLSAEKHEICQLVTEVHILSRTLFIFLKLIRQLNVNNAVTLSVGIHPSTRQCSQRVPRDQGKDKEFFSGDFHKAVRKGP